MSHKIKELDIEVKALKDATSFSIIELEKSISSIMSFVSQLDSRLKQSEQAIKFIQNNFQKNEKNINHKCDN